MNKVLIIDDDIDVALITSLILENSGYSVKTEDGTNDMNTVILDYKPQLILLDANLNKTSGIDLSQELKKDSKTSPIPIILFTGYDFDVDEILKTSQADDFLQKPFDRNELLDKISRFITLAIPPERD